MSGHTSLQSPDGQIPKAIEDRMINLETEKTMKSMIALAVAGVALVANVAFAQDAGLDSPEWKQLLKARPAATQTQEQARASNTQGQDRYDYLSKYSPL